MASFHRDEVYHLIMQLHRCTMMKLHHAGKKKYTGLASAGRGLQLGSNIQRKLRGIDFTVGLVKKISPYSIEEFPGDLDKELSSFRAEHDSSAEEFKTSESGKPWDGCGNHSGPKKKVEEGKTGEEQFGDEHRSESGEPWDGCGSRHSGPKN